MPDSLIDPFANPDDPTPLSDFLRRIANRFGAYQERDRARSMFQ
jgi:hypothetical protein